MASAEVPIVAPIPAAPVVAAAPAAARREGITQVSGDYVAGLWYGEVPAPLPPSTSYVMPFERKASAAQRKAELDRIKHDRAEADIAEAKRKGGVLGSIKATTMSVFAKARGTPHTPANRKLARKEKKFNATFKFAQPETLLFQSKKLRLVNRHNNSSMLGKLWISNNFICFRESLRGTKARTMLTIPAREIVCIQRARALKVMEANAVPEFQPYNDMDSSADSIQLYMRDRELHQFTGFWDHKSLEDTYHTLDYVWRPQAYASEVAPAAMHAGEQAPADASGSSSVEDDAQRTVPPYAAPAAVPIAGAAVAAAPLADATTIAAGRPLTDREAPRTAPPYAAVAPAVVVPAAAAVPSLMVSAPREEIRAPAARSQVISSEPFVVRPVGETAIVSRLPEERRALPSDLRTQIENYSAFFPRRHVIAPERPPLSALVAETAPLAASRAAKSPSFSGLTGGARRTYPRQPEALLREIRGFRRSTLLRPRVRRAWRSPAFARLLRDIRSFNLRKLKHVPAPIIRSQLPQVRARRRPVTRAYPSLMSAELKERICAFSSLGLLANFRHVVPRENRFLSELRLGRLPLPHVRSAQRPQLLNEIARFNHTWLRQIRVPRRRFAQIPGMDEIFKMNRTPAQLLQDIRTFSRSRLRRASISRAQLPVQQSSRQASFAPAAASSAPAPAWTSERHPEWSPVAQMAWWPALSAALRQPAMHRLRHVPLPSVPVFRAADNEARPIAECTTAPKPLPARDATGSMSKFTEVVEKKVMIVERMPARSTNYDGAALSV